MCVTACIDMCFTNAALTPHRRLPRTSPLAVTFGVVLAIFAAASIFSSIALRNKIEESGHESAEAAKQARLAQVATVEANEAKALAERAKAEGMTQAVGQLERVVEVVSSASEHLSAQRVQSSRGTEMQAARVAETATSEEINRGIDDINRTSSETSDAMRQPSQAVGELASQTQSLRALIERMKAGG